MSKPIETSAKQAASGGCDRAKAVDPWIFEAEDSRQRKRHVALHRSLNLLKALLTNGGDDQAFVGAKWLVFLLRLTPRFLKRNVALRILAISPHYFYRSIRADYARMPTNQFLEAEFERNRLSREAICNQVLLPYLKPDSQVLEIGCGPGFLTKAVARHVEKAYGCDISMGVLECCRIINGAANINYIYSGESGFAHIPNSSLNLAYSFAVIQHLREAVIRSLFEVASKKLRAGGLCLFQIQIDDGRWKSESAWMQEQSLTGRLRLKYGLNFFPRTEEFFRQMAADNGLSVVAMRAMSELLEQSFDNVYHQHLLIMSKL